MAETLNLNWKSPGRAATQFMQCEKPVQILNGPIGAGKTTTCVIKALRLAARQSVSTTTLEHAHPLRKFKLCVVRDTYRQLWKTTLPSWWKRVPKAVGEFTGAENAPATHKVQFDLPDGTRVDFHVDFIAIGENSAEDVLRGYEPTVFYLNEADLLAKDVYMFAKGRAGRYPDMAEGGPSWYGIIMDCNAPVLTSWLYLEMFRTTPADVGLFRQPSGISSNAENLVNLPPGYYEKQREGQEDWYIKRMIENVPGYTRHGKPIYKDFEDTRHVAQMELAVEPRLPLLLGLDAGGSPAAVFAQRMPSGQWRIIDEMLSDQSTGPTRFGEMLAFRLKERYDACKTIRAWADPSAAYGADKTAGELDWIEIVSHQAGIQVLAAPTNALIPRWDAVRRPLKQSIDGKPAFLLCPVKCPMLREGFNSGYGFRKLPGNEVERYSEEPDKNAHSHPHDALQYVMSAEGEDLAIRGRHEQSRDEVRGAQHVHDWDPFASAS